MIIPFLASGYQLALPGTASRIRRRRESCARIIADVNRKPHIIKIGVKVLSLISPVFDFSPQAMGNYPAKAMSFPHHAGMVTVSTRSVPPDGYAVLQDIGIVTANSSAFTQNGGEKECMMQVLDLARRECKRLRGNYILGTHFEIKQFGDRGSWMVYSLTGMACVVQKQAASSAATTAAPTGAAIPVATATVFLGETQSSSSPDNPYSSAAQKLNL
jgi:hypothetical protein